MTQSWNNWMCYRMINCKNNKMKERSIKSILSEELLDRIQSALAYLLRQHKIHFDGYCWGQDKPRDFENPNWWCWCFCRDMLMMIMDNDDDANVYAGTSLRTRWTRRLWASPLQATQASRHCQGQHHRHHHYCYRYKQYHRHFCQHVTIIANRDLSNLILPALHLNDQSGETMVVNKARVVSKTKKVKKTKKTKKVKKVKTDGTENRKARSPRAKSKASTALKEKFVLSNARLSWDYFKVYFLCEERACVCVRWGEAGGDS